MRPLATPLRLGQLHALDLVTVENIFPVAQRLQEILDELTVLTDWKRT